MSRAAAAGALLFLVAAPLHAQDQELRDAFQRFQSELDQTRDTVRLRALEQRFGGRGASSEVEAIRLQYRGLARLRIGRVWDGWSFGRAADDFERVTRLEPAWSAAWYALGVAHNAAADWIAADPINLGHRLGESDRRSAVATLARAAELEPGAVAPLLTLVTAGSALRDTARLIHIILPALRQARAPADTDPPLLAERARLEREYGDPDSAIAVAERYLEHGGPSGRARLELARSLLARGSAAGLAPYFDGAADDDSVTVSGYRLDLAYIADDGVLRGFDLARGAERADLLRRFWRALDRRDLRGEGAWLKEHYRRLAYARRHFALLTNRHRYHVRDGYDSRSTEFDDRGIVYLRHGEPDRVVGRRAAPDRQSGWSSDSLPLERRADTLNLESAGTGRETWLYLEGDSVMLVEFAAGAVTIQHSGDPDDYRLVPVLTALPGSTDPGIRERLLTLCPDLVRDLERAPMWRPFAQARAAAEIWRFARASIARSTTTLAHALRFPRFLPVTAELLVVGRSGTSGIAHVVYAIPRAPAAPADSSKQFRFPVRLRFMAERADGPTADLDTTEMVTVAAADSARWILGRFGLPLAPGRWRYRMALEVDRTFGRVLADDSVDVPTAGEALSVSDLAVGQPGLGVPWQAGPGDDAWLQAVHEVRQSDPLDLYFEVYGLDAGQTFNTTLTVRAGKRVSLSLASAELATGPLTRVHRTAAIGDLKPGRYLVSVRVTGEGMSVESRARQIEIPRP